MGCAEYLNEKDFKSILAYRESNEFKDYLNKGEMGETIAILVAEKLGWKSTGFKPAYHGFDNVFRDGEKIVVVIEAKEREDKLGPETLSTDKQGHVQAEPDWILAKATRMQDHNSALYADNPENKMLGREIQDKFERERFDEVRSVIIQTLPSTYDVYIWEYVNGKWEQANFFEGSEIEKGLNGNG